VQTHIRTSAIATCSLTFQTHAIKSFHHLLHFCAVRIRNTPLSLGPLLQTARHSTSSGSSATHPPSVRSIRSAVVEKIKGQPQIHTETPNYIPIIFKNMSGRCQKTLHVLALMFKTRGRFVSGIAPACSFLGTAHPDNFAVDSALPRVRSERQRPSCTQHAVRQCRVS